jgi:hypothetical protein
VAETKPCHQYKATAHQMISERCQIFHNYLLLKCRSASILGLPDAEVVLFKSIVEARSLRRRASRLIPLPVPPGKAKTRELILTSRRLICLKQQRSKGLGGISIKSELALRASEKLKEKDKEKESRGIVAGVERKGEREFVVLTVRSSPPLSLYYLISSYEVIKSL